MSPQIFPSKKFACFIPYAPTPSASGFGVGFGCINTFSQGFPRALGQREKHPQIVFGKKLVVVLGGGNSNMFQFHPYLGKIPF